ncbi:hypothetical protein Tamer19_47400 [Cupriavidus sp. TA19]|nr:hypothetical protein Tamer19_47400 [Cupriavidus sp. TA19]
MAFARAGATSFLAGQVTLDKAWTADSAPPKRGSSRPSTHLVRPASIYRDRARTFRRRRIDMVDNREPDCETHSVGVY